MQGFALSVTRVARPLGRVLAGTLFITMLGCTKTRPQQWPDGVAQDVFEKQYIAAQSATVTLSEAVSVQSENLGILALGEMTDLAIEKVEVDARILPMFADLRVFGRPGASYEVKFEVGTKKVTGFKIVGAQELAELPVMEQQIAKKKGLQAWIPIFEFEIETQGVVEAVKNDLGEATRTLQITPTNSEKATHVQISTLKAKRLMVGIQEGDRDSAREVFLKEQIDGAMFTREELSRKLQINVSEAGLYLTKLGGETLSLFKVSKLSELSSDLQQLILEQDKGVSLATKDVRRCTSAEKALVPIGISSECVVVLAYEVNQISFVNAERLALDKDGTLSNSITFVPSLKQDGAAFIRIAKDPALRSVSKDEQVSRLDPRSTLSMEDVKSSEFLMRRTMKDSPNTFSYTFAGASGGLEIVKFVPEDKQLRVVRADALLKTDGSTSVDQETLMLLPARYFKVVNVDDKGNPISQPRTVGAHWSEEGAIASIDWTLNSIPTINSPLDFFGVEQCFSQLSERKVSEVDHRLKRDGMLNFTLTSTYAGNRGSFDCAGIESAGYFDTVQKTFTFEERVSFKKYVKLDKEQPLLNVPYEAQKKLGFGLFTYKKKQPNDSGLTHVDGTEIPLPAIFDIRNGKKIKYVLAGLPKGSDARSTEIRARITQATREVIDDLNRSFRTALQGSAMERSSDVIELLVEGVNSDAGQLGDLDRNHVFYVEKSTDSGIIGLGGAHANPRSGIVESASVYLYGGNMLSMVDALRRLASAKKLYDDQMAVLTETAGPVEETPAIESEEVAGSGASSGAGEGAQLRTASLKQSSARLTNRLAAMQPTRALKNSVLRRDKRALKSAVVDRANMLTRMQPGVLRVEHQDMRRSLSKLSAQQLVYARAFNELINAKKLGDKEAIGQALYKFRNTQGATRGVSVKAKMRAANICLYDVGAMDALVTASLSGEAEILAKKSDLEILADVWKGTLTHEIGHNLGLRHNFEGSFDAANWKFSTEEDSKRDYSSIMDYLQDDHLTYDGMGPQDVASLRAAYAGLLELNPQSLASVQTDAASGLDFVMSGAQVKTQVLAKKYVRISDYLKSVGLSTWLDLTPERTGALPLKGYKFCSDEEAGTRPTCNLFDKGSTPGEIVANIVAAYKERYSLSNFANDRLVFNDWNLDGYTGRLFGQFMTIRQFLEETFYQAIVVGADGETINQHVDAAIKGLLFFNEVIRTPDAPAGISNEERFVKVEKDVPREDGSGTDHKTYTIERKSLKSIANGSESERLRVRGIELDKTIATIMLTNRDFGFPRYEQASLRLAYPDLEKLLIDDPSALALPTVALINEILKDNVAAAGSTPEGTIEAPASMKAEMSELIRTYATLGAVVDLDAVGLTAQDNISSSFRMMSQMSTVAKGTPFLMQPGAANDIRYFAYPEAVVARSLVDQGSLLGTIRGMKVKLSPMVNEWLKLSLGIVPEATVETGATPVDPKVKMAELEKKINKELKKLPETSGPRTMVELSGVFGDILGVAQQIDELTQTLPVSLFYDDINGIKNQLDSMTKSAPTLALVFDSIKGEELGSSNFDALSPAGIAEFTEYSMFRNAQMMSDFLLMIHPEYRK